MEDYLHVHVYTCSFNKMISSENYDNCISYLQYASIKTSRSVSVLRSMYALLLHFLRSGYALDTL